MSAETKGFRSNLRLKVPSLKPKTEIVDIRFRHCTVILLFQPQKFEHSLILWQTLCETQEERGLIRMNVKTWVHNNPTNKNCLMYF